GGRSLRAWPRSCAAARLARAGTRDRGAHGIAAHRVERGLASRELRRAFGFLAREARPVRAVAPAIARRIGRGTCRHHGDAVHGAGRNAKLAARTLLHKYRMHHFGRADDRVDRTGLDALRAADAGFLVDDRDLARLLDAVGGIERNDRTS